MKNKSNNKSLTVEKHKYTNGTRYEIPWSEMFAKYISTEGMTMLRLAQEYGVSRRSVELHASKDSWVKKREEATAKAMQLAEEQAVIRIKDHNEQHIKMADRVLSIVEKQLDAGIVPKNAKDLATWMDLGVKVSRDGLGMNNKNQSLSFNKKNESITLTWGDSSPVTPR